MVVEKRPPVLTRAESAPSDSARRQRVSISQRQPAEDTGRSSRRPTRRQQTQGSDTSSQGVEDSDSSTTTFRRRRQSPIQQQEARRKKLKVDFPKRRREYFSEEEGDDESDEEEEDEAIGEEMMDDDDDDDLKIERIFACRWRDTASEKVMEYLLKFEGESYRQLKWLTRKELVGQKSDQRDFKIVQFHRRLSGGAMDVEVSLSGEQLCCVMFAAQDQGNTSLYSKIDRVISVRRPSDSCSSSSSSSSLGRRCTKSDKQYLIKWQLLGYAQATWVNESELDSSEDREAIARFDEINTSFEFPMCAPAAPILPATAAEPPAGVIKGEKYTSDTVMNAEGATKLWRTFLKRKIASDGKTYVPSIRKKGTDTIISARCLMAHQQEGLKWLFYNTEVNEHGSLLADEMGLGKTCQSISFLEHFLEIMSAGRGGGCHSLVVVQKSVLENWRREFDVWTPHLNVLPLCGGRADRVVIKEHEFRWLSPETGKKINPPSTPNRKHIKPDVVLVTYEGLRTDEFRDLTAHIRGFKWACVVVDECQKVKGGRNSLLLQMLAQLKRDFMILLTGTPIQNTTEELFPMLTLLHPTKFHYESTSKNNSNSDGWSESRFNSSFSNIQERENCMQLTEELHTLMSPYILRREKSHVLKTLPPKTVKLVKIPLTLIQKRVYSALYHKSIRTRGLKFSNIHMQLRKCCIHPFLIEGMEELIFEGKINNNDNNNENNNNNNNNDGDELSFTEKSKKLLLESSGKFILLKKMLESYWLEGRKVLIFSFFKTALDLIEDFINLNQFPWGSLERVDGETTGEERQLAIDRFNTSDLNKFIFLCTTRAGGLGINLTSASVVIHLDSDYNPQHDLQAQARCHRIGQDRNVDVFHFIAEHTYEDYMLFTIAGKKLGLEAVLLGRLDNTKGKIKLDKSQEEKVLRKGVFAAIRDDAAAVKDANEFAESSIEVILSTKATTMTLIEEEKNQDNTKKHSFSTAKFDTTNEQIIDEDLPDFWMKVAQQLGPWSIEEEKQPELTRADRRRGKAVSYRSSIYGDDYYETTKIGNNKCLYQNEIINNNNNNNEKEDDDIFTPSSSSEQLSDENSSDDIIENVVTKEDLEIGGLKKKELKIDKLKIEKMVIDKQAVWGDIYNNNGTIVTNSNCPVTSGGVLVAMELLYRCLRALKRWRSTRIGECGALRTEDIRDADKNSPWAINDKKLNNNTAADQLLRQSWLETLQEWKQAGIDWETKRSNTVDHWAKVVLQEKRNILESQWLINSRSRQEILKSKEQLINQMNSFFVAEARRLAIALYGDLITTHLQSLCDDAAAEILTGRQQFTIKKQTWIGAEDFCIKLVFIHLMARRYTITNTSPVLKLINLRWPPPQLEVNWSIMTEVVKRLNRYTGGPERRKAAIHERFYNKLDSRWNHDEFSNIEKEILAIATANGLAPHIVAEEMPGRSLERVKKGMKCPSVQREAQKEIVILQRQTNIDNTPIIDVVAKFRSICRIKLNGKMKEDDQEENLHQKQKLIIQQQQQQLDYDTINTLVDCIKLILIQIGVDSNDFEKLRSSLLIQSQQNLIKLLQQLRLLQKGDINNSKAISLSTEINENKLPSSSSDQLLEIQHRMKIDPIFASEVIEYIDRVRK